MKYRALVSFSGLLVSMAQGEVREITDSALAERLIKVGYIMSVDVKPEKPAKVETADTDAGPEEKPKKRKGKK